MSIPLLSFAPSTQNPRVNGFEIPGDDQPVIFSTDNLLSGSELDSLIEAAYRQIFFHAFAADREPCLESQLRCGQITVRDFIRGLLVSNTYKNSFYRLNNNYRFVEQCVQRVLGRDVYSEREKIAWSIVIATKGVEGFVDALLNSDEYLDAFGFSTVPYQRRRSLPGRSEGETPFNIKSPRYEAYHRSKLGFPKAIFQGKPRSTKRAGDQPRTGNPDDFLAMARSLSLSGAQAMSASTAIDYEKLVPYRKSTANV